MPHKNIEFGCLRKRIFGCIGIYAFNTSRYLDTLGKEVSSLGDVVGGGEGGAELVGDANAGGKALGPEAEDAEHGKTAVLELLKALLLVLLGGVVEAEGVPPSLALADAKVAGLVGGTLLADDADAPGLEVGHEEEDLEDGGTGDLGEGLEGVGVGVGVEAGGLVAGEGAEKAGGDEANDGELGDAAVDELGLTVPGEVAELTVAALEASEPGSDGDGGEAKGVETGITEHGSVEGGGGSGEGEGLGRSGVGPGGSAGGAGGLFISAKRNANVRSMNNNKQV